MTRPGRRARFAALCLGLGSISTIAVAWLLTLDFHSGMVPMRFAIAGSTLYGKQIVSRRDSLGGIALAASISASVPGHWFTLPEQWRPLAEFVPRWSHSELLDWAPTGPDTTRGIVATGWPMLSMWSSFDQQPSPGYWWYKARNGFVLGPPPATPNYFALLSPCERTLPTRIVWHGFAISTLFWSLAWMTLLLAPGLARRAYRRKRNRCAACGYSRAGLADAAACPECGLSRDQ